MYGLRDRRNNQQTDSAHKKASPLYTSTSATEYSCLWRQTVEVMSTNRSERAFRLEVVNTECPLAERCSARSSQTLRIPVLDKKFPTSITGTFSCARFEITTNSFKPDRALYG